MKTLGGIVEKRKNESVEAGNTQSGLFRTAGENPVRCVLQMCFIPQEEEVQQYLQDRLWELVSVYLSTAGADIISGRRPSKCQSRETHITHGAERHN